MSEKKTISYVDRTIPKEALTEELILSMIGKPVTVDNDPNHVIGKIITAQLIDGNSIGVSAEINADFVVDQFSITKLNFTGIKKPIKIVADRKINDYRNRTTWEINREKSNFCCKKLESLREGFTIDSTSAIPKPYLKIKSGHDYYDGEYSNEEEVEFCPFCGIKIIVAVSTYEKTPQVICSFCNKIIFEYDIDLHRQIHINQKAQELNLVPTFKTIEDQT